jgi:hypothetical protein
VVLPAIVLGIVVASVVGSLRGGFDQLSQQAAPQVAASADLYVALSDMDAQVANVLLVGNDAGLSDNRKHAMDVYAQGRSQADGDLQKVAAIGGTDPTVAHGVTSILDLFGRYQALAGEALSLDPGPAGQPPPTTLAVYRQATALMPALLGDTQSLIATGRAALNATYTNDQSLATSAEVWVIVIGILLVAALVYAQVVLRRRLRRRVNPAIAGATVVALAVLVLVSALLSGAASQLRTAEQDAFDPIIALSQARAVSQEAVANESRYLVDPASAVRYQQAFQDESQQVIALAGADINHYDVTLRTALDAYNSGDGEVTGWSGLLPAVVVVLIVGLLAVGVWPRLAEYRR